MRYFLQIAYKGFSFRGWQRQVGGVASVQEALENALRDVFKIEIPVVGCGRTDARVNATQFFLHLDLDASWEPSHTIRINQILPKEIVVYDAYLVASDAHARFDAIERTYDYYIHTQKDPFLNDKSLLYMYRPLDFDAMKEATEILSKYSDFLSFCKRPSQNHTTNCTISKVSFRQNINGDRMVFSISANRFLRGMVRALVQKLLEVGNGSMGLEEFEELFTNPQKEQIDSLAAPYGLYLSKVKYPYLDLPTLASAPVFW